MASPEITAQKSLRLFLQISEDEITIHYCDLSYRYWLLAIVRTIVTSRGMLIEATTYDTKRDTWKAIICENPLTKKYCCVPKELVDVAEKTSRAFDGHVDYIDYFETSSGFVLDEISRSRGLIDHERISGYLIAYRLRKFLAKFQKL
jgi:hypothetical protein